LLSPGKNRNQKCRERHCRIKGSRRDHTNRHVSGNRVAIAIFRRYSTNTASPQ
jgi:hypothetical protein